MNVRIKGADLEQAILSNVNLMAQIYAEKLKKGKEYKSEVESLSNSIMSLKKEQERLSAKKVRLYEEYRSTGDREGYIRRKTENEKRLSEIAESLAEMELNLETARQNDIISSCTKEALHDVEIMESFEKELLKKVIDKVVVYGPDRIEIIWKPLDTIFQKVTAGIGVVDL